MQNAPNASKHSFLPHLFSCERKDGAAGGNKQSQIFDNLSVSASPSQHPYPFCPFGTFPPDRGNRPLEGEPFYHISNSKKESI